MDGDYINGFAVAYLAINAPQKQSLSALI